jgi:hypothetical protein
MTPATLKRANARRSKAAAAHNEIRRRVEEAILDILAERATGSDRLTALVLERVPEATREDVSHTRTRMKGKTGQIEVRANKLQLSGYDRTKPITDVEKEVVDAIGSGATAREVAARCNLVRSAFSARTICAALVVRGVLAEKSSASATVYAPVAGKESAS